MSVPLTSSEEVDVTPSKRKQIPSSSSDNSPVGGSELTASQNSKRQDKKRRRKQRLKEALELEKKKETEIEDFYKEIEETETVETMTNEQSPDIHSKLADINLAVTNINSQMATLATKETLSELKSVFCKSIESLEAKVEKMSGELFVAQQQNEGLQKALSAVSQRNRELEAELKAQSERIRLNEKKHNDLEQHSRKQNLRVFGVPEPQGGEKESAEDCMEKVAQIFKEKIGVKVGVEQIEVAHRTGSLAAARANKRVRPIIVRFLSRKDRETVIMNRKNLKGKGVSVGEDLTTANLKILKRLEEHTGTLSAWSARGNLFAKLKNGTIIKADMMTDIKKVIDESMNGRGDVVRGSREDDTEMA